MTIMSKVDHLELVTDFPSFHSISIYIVDDTGIVSTRVGCVPPISRWFHKTATYWVAKLIASIYTTEKIDPLLID